MVTRADSDVIAYEMSILSEVYRKTRDLGREFLEEAQRLTKSWQGDAATVSWRLNLGTAMKIEELVVQIATGAANGYDIAENYNTVEELNAGKTLSKDFLD